MKIFQNVILEDFDLCVSDIEIYEKGNRKTAIVTKESWDYEKSLTFQEMLIEKIYENPDEGVLIFCNHPSCLTLGKGLQKTDEDKIVLVDFDPLVEERLPVKVHRIKRGGGITFHHEKQIVFYPLFSLTENKLKIFDFLLFILQRTKDVLEEHLLLPNLKVRQDLLGLWAGESKIASIGLSSRKFISYHGMALNLGEDEKIKKSFEEIYPCGLPGNTYSCLENVLGKEISFKDIQQILLREFLKI